MATVPIKSGANERLYEEKFTELQKAVKEEKIWYTDKSLYQFASKTGTIIDNLYCVFSENSRASFVKKLLIPDQKCIDGPDFFVTILLAALMQF